MYSLSIGTNSGYFTQDDNDISSVEIGDLSTLDPVISNSTFIDQSVSINSLSMTRQLSQFLYTRYGYISNFEKIPKVYEDSYLQEYATSRGYQFTDDFLSIMNKHKLYFIGKIELILIDLANSFSFFFKELKDHNENIIKLVDKVSFYFSKKVYDLNPKCINVLRHNIIPITIKSIFDSNVIEGGHERKMIYHEMEHFFLYFITTLENLIMVKIMEYWRDFCNKNIGTSLLTGNYYNNPFVRAYDLYGISIPKVTCPAAFTSKFGEYISFFAIAKIDEIVGYFIDKCNGVLKKVAISKCYCIFSLSGCIDNCHLKGVRDWFKILVKEEFDKKIIEERVDDKIGNFLKIIFVWDECGTLKEDRVSIFDNVIRYMYNFLVNTSSSELFSIIKFFQEINRLGVNIHPECNSKFLSIRNKFLAKSRKIIRGRFCAMIKEGYKFSDGTVISMVDWDDISENMFPIAQEILKRFVSAELKELHVILANALVIEDICVFDGYYTGTRKITPEEVDGILKISTEFIHAKNRKLVIKIWTELVTGKKVNFSEYSYTSSKLVSTNKSNDSLVPSPSVQSKLKINYYKSVAVWGLNLHPDDYNLILAIKRKFSIQIIDHLTELFSGMFRRKAILPSGIVPSDSSWCMVSSELSKIAVEYLEPINEKKYAELDKVLSNARIVDVNESDFSSCVIREITDDEKNYFMASSKKFMDENLMASIKKSWSIVHSKVNKSTIKYGYKEKYQDVDIEDVEGKWGVKLRYVDNIAILKVRKEFSSRMKVIIYNKFSSIVSNVDKFDDNFIGAFAWFRVSRKLIPIAKDAVKVIVGEEREELEKTISRARIVVDCEFDREPTNKEKSTVLDNVMSLVNRSLKILFRIVWRNVINESTVIPLKGNSVDVRDSTEAAVCNVDCVSKVSSSAVSALDRIELDESYNNDGNYKDKVRLCYEDDLVILNMRRKFSSEICNHLSNKFTEMINENYKFDDNKPIGLYYWANVSKKLLPIIKKETDPIIKNEVVRISEALLESRVVVSSSGGFDSTLIMRKLTFKERSYVLKKIMNSVSKQLISNSRIIWNKLVKLPSLSLSNLSEEDKLEISNIRLEFIGSLGLIVKEVINSLLPDTDASVSGLEYMGFNACNIVYERSRNFFKEGGFFSRVESLLSEAQVVDLSGNNRFLVDEEKKYILREFMDIINFDRDCLVRKRTSEKLSNMSTPAVVDLPVKLSIDNEINVKCNNKPKINITTDGII